MSKTVFISSTSLDLKEYRQAAIQTCHQLGFQTIAMENFEAMGVGATEGSKRKLREADLYVGIIAHRYGYIEAGYDRSVTEIEFDYASERGLDRLCFLVDPAFPWPETTRDYENVDRLNAFKAKIEKAVIRSLFGGVEDFQHKLVEALVNWQEWRTVRGGELDAVLVHVPDDVPSRPEALIGRDELMAEADSLLDKNKRVLLQGFGGMGKTALAATITARRVETGKGTALWLRAGTEDRDGLLLALARPFDGQQAVTKETSSAGKARVVRQMIAGHNIRLVVLDDVWNGRALTQLLNINAIPTSAAILVTSRHRFSGLTRLDVGRLTRAASLALLSRYGEPDWMEDTEADELCDMLGDHAFAVRLAGLTLALDSLAPGELLRRVQSAPYKLAAPEGAEEEGRTSFEDLLHTSLYTLDGEAREVFLAFGAFFTASATPEMLALYMGRDPAAIEDALNRLQRRGLAERLAESSERVVEYQIHDLAYSYAKAQATDTQRHRALDTCLAYIARYKDPNPDHFAPLRSELDNFSGAVNWAMQVERYADVERFADWLYRETDSHTSEGFLHLQGYASAATALLTQAAAAAAALGQRREQAVYLGNLGSAYRDLGQVKQGMKHYRQALKIYRDSADTGGEGLTLGRLGIAYRLLGQADQAIEHLQQALAIARSVNDSRMEGINLANLGIAHRLRGDTEAALDYLGKALVIARDRHDERGEAINLGNLGDIYRDLRKLDEAADYYQKALQIARETNDRRGSGINLGRLGDVYRAQGSFDLAIEYLEQALQIARETGDKRGEAINLGRLGDTFRDQGQMKQATESHEMALTIARQMDDKRGEGFSLFDLGADYFALKQYRKAASYYESARGIFAALGLQNQVEAVDERIAQTRLAARQKR